MGNKNLINRVTCIMKPIGRELKKEKHLNIEKLPHMERFIHIRKFYIQKKFTYKR